MKKSTLCIIIVILVILVIFFWYGNKDSLKNEPGKDIIKSDPMFFMKNDLSCEIKLSSDQDEIGRTLSFLDLETDNPRFLSDSGMSTDATKIYETENTLIFGMMGSLSGSTDIIVLDKEKGTFARTESGNFIGVFAFASKGICK